MRTTRMRTHRSVPAIDIVGPALGYTLHAPKTGVARLQIGRNRSGRIEAQCTHDCAHRFEHPVEVAVL